MAPIERGTIHIEEIRNHRGRSKQVVIAQGDNRDPGRWEHLYNHQKHGAKISQGIRAARGEECILDVPVDKEDQPIATGTGVWGWRKVVEGDNGEFSLRRELGRTRDTERSRLLKRKIHGVRS